MTADSDHPHRHVAPAVVPWILRTAQLDSQGHREAEPFRGHPVDEARGAWGRPGALSADPDARIAATVLRLPPGCVVGGWAAARVHERAARPDDGGAVFTGEAWHGPRAQDPERVGASRSTRVLVCAPRSARVRPGAALAYGLVLQALSFVLLATAVNLLAAFLALAGFLGYVLVYTMWLKRTTPQNIVIGGAAGAVPPLVGWAAVTGHVDPTAWYLFAIVF